MNLEEKAVQIAECCQEMRFRAHPEETVKYTLHVTEQERADILEGLELRAEGFMDRVYGDLDDNPDLAFQWHTAAHQIHHLVDRIRTTDPDPRVFHDVSEAHKGIVIAEPAAATLAKISKAERIVNLLDDALAFHQGKNRATVEIEGPDGWIDLADILDQLIEALNADRG